MQSHLDKTAARHGAYKAALIPVARRAIDRGDFPDVKSLMQTDAERDAHAVIVANYAATDLCLTRRTRLLPMLEVYEAIPELESKKSATIERLPEVTSKVRKLDPAIWGDEVAA